jgi:hypothetical protein
MTSRERVILALAHKEPDRLPVDFGSTAVSGMHVSSIAALRDYFGLEKRLVKCHEPFQMLGILDEDLKQVLGLDVEGVFPSTTMFGFRNAGWKPWRMPDGLEVLVSTEFNVTTDAGGDVLIYPEGDVTAPPSGRMPAGGYFFDAIVRQEPIEEEKLNVADNLEEFKLMSDRDLQELAAQIDVACSTGRAVMGSIGGTAFGDIALVPAPFLKHPKGIRDISEWYMSTTSRRDYIHQIFEKQCEIAIQNLARLHEIAGDRLDAIFLCGTDFGTQTSSFCSVKTFRDLYFPYYKRLNEWIHLHTSWKTFKHSCGSVDRFIPSMIEAGFDILNPVQCSAVGMEARHLKEAYGDRLTFWGGGVDTQKTLPFGTPEQVRAEVLERCRIFSRGGGFVFDTIHNVQARTPVENLVAMFQAVGEFNGAPMQVA